MKKFSLPVIISATALGVGLGLATRNVGVGIAVGLVFWLLWKPNAKCTK